MKIIFSKNKVFLILILFLLISVFLFFLNYFFDRLKENINNQSYVSGVIPHHLVADSIIEKFFLELSKNNSPELIVLFGPDHFNAEAVYGNRLISVNRETLFLDSLAIDREVVGRLSKLALSDYSIKNDHGITNILPFIKSYFPKTKIIPILIPADFPLEKIKEIINDLNKNLPQNSFILASVDFSHYFTKEVANIHDQKSIQTLINFEEQNFSTIDVDCRQCLFAIRYFAKLRKQEKYTIIDHKNSQDYSGDIILDSTTSYFSVIFGKNINSK